MKPRTCPDYHCDLGMIVPGSDKRDFRPFKSAYEMTAMLGIDVETWLKRNSAKRCATQSRQSSPRKSKQTKVNIFEQLKA